jgi:hypothetical protein
MTCLVRALTHPQKKTSGKKVHQLILNSSQICKLLGPQTKAPICREMAKQEVETGTPTYTFFHIGKVPSSSIRPLPNILSAALWHGRWLSSLSDIQHSHSHSPSLISTLPYIDLRSFFIPTALCDHIPLIFLYVCVYVFDSY